MIWLLLSLGCNLELPDFMEVEGLTGPSPETTASTSTEAAPMAGAAIEDEGVVGDEGPMVAEVEVDEPIEGGDESNDALEGLAKVTEEPLQEPLVDEVEEEVLIDEPRAVATMEKVSALSLANADSIAENAGILGALSDSELDGVFGGSSLDQDLVGGFGGLIGAEGVQYGSGGLGSRGSGLGGGGTAEGLGGLGTKGMGSLGTKGTGSGISGYGSGGGHLYSGTPGASAGDPIILGSLDRSLIDAVIKRHMNQIRYCYQRELTTNPELAGKLKIKFYVAKDGSVSKADISTSTMNSAVDACVTGRFMRMKFPEPKGGGIVIVKYPFVFTPG
jgi:hypothetical protein